MEYSRTAEASTKTTAPFFTINSRWAARTDGSLPLAREQLDHQTWQDARRDILVIVLFEDNSHIFGSNFGDLLDGQKEAESLGVASKDKGKPGVIADRCPSRKPSLKYIVC